MTRCWSTALPAGARCEMMQYVTHHSWVHKESGRSYHEKTHPPKAPPRLYTFELTVAGGGQG